jgi:multiple sugar transport system permease protein
MTFESSTLPGVAAPPATNTGMPRASKYRQANPIGDWINRQFWLVSVLPTVLIMVVIFGAPLLFSFFLSFRGWSATKSIVGGDFVGLENYELLFTDPAFLKSIVLTVIYTAVTVSFELVLGLGVALLLNRDVRFIGMARTLLIMPMMMTPIVAALCWKLLLDPEYGFINYLIGSKIVWVGDPTLAPFAVMLVNVWQNVPYVAILLLAALRSLPTDPREAAVIDGANGWQIFWHITLPAMRPAIMVALLLRVIFEFRAFDNVYVMTGGGPGGATALLSIFTYALTFAQFDFPLGAAASWIMLVLCFLLCTLPVLVFRRWKVES